MSASAFSASAIISFSLIGLSLIMMLMRHRSLWSAETPARDYQCLRLPRLGILAALNG